MRSPAPYVPILTFLIVAACGGVEQPPPASPPVPATSAAAAASAPLPSPAEKLTADTARTTAGGATFTVPAGWSIESRGVVTILAGPESDLRVAISDSNAKSADQAIAAAWSAAQPGFKRPVMLTTPTPGRRGWDEKLEVEYETSPNEKLVVYAMAMRRGDKWLAFVLESGRATLEKRAAAVRLVAGSLRPAGYTKESFAGKTAHALDAPRVQQLTAFMEKARVANSLPGVAIALVQGDKVVFQGGFGVRELGKPAKVDENTLFMIASNSKALTTLLLATEVDEGKFTWDTPVTQVYPGFRLGSAEVTEKVLMKHLVCACTGLPRQDMEWLFEYEHATAKSVMALLGTMQPTTQFGETFQYSNIMASAAGFIGGYVLYPHKELGAAFDLAMKSRVFDPLGMRATTFDFKRALAGNHASPHGEDTDGRMAVAAIDIDRSIVPARPAGGAWSSASDLVKYVQLELAKGKIRGGRQLLSEQCLVARQAPQVPVGEDRTYGMGLMVEREYGIPVVHHGGDLIGYHSDMFWLPDHGVGGVILTNGDGGWLVRRPFIRRVLEVLFDGDLEAEEDVISAAQAHKAELAKARERLVVPPTADAVSKLADHYESKELGTIDVRSNGAARVFDFGEWRSAVASRKNDDGTTSFITIGPGVFDGFEFVLAEREGKRALILRDMQHEYVFVEAPHPKK